MTETSAQPPRGFSSFGMGRFGEGIAAQEFFSLARRYAWLVVGIVVIAMAIAYVALQNVTPLYTATTSLLIDSRQEDVVDVEAVMPGLSTDVTAVESQVEVITSRALMRRVADSLDLVDDPAFNGTQAEPGVLSRLNPLTWFSSDDEGPDISEEERRNIVRENVVGALVSGTTVARRGVTLVIDISFTSEDPAQSARIANAIADAYIVDQLEAKYEATRRANEWLAERLADLGREVETSEQAVEIYKRENNLTSSQGLTLTEQQLSELNAQLVLAKTALAEKEAQLSRYRQLARSGGGADTMAQVLDSPVIADLRSQEAELLRREADLASRYGDRHPEMIKVRAERRDLGRAIEAEVKRTIANVENEVAVARTRVSTLRKELGQLESEQSDSGVAEVRLRELERKAEASRSLYETFLGRFKQLSGQQELQQPDARVLSEARQPGAPSYPRTKLILFMVLVFALLLAAGLVLLLEHLDNAFSTDAQLSDQTKLPNLAMVPLSTDVKTRPWRLVVDKPLSSFSEAFRAIRVSLSLSDIDTPPKVVLVTSALPGDGKTTTSIALAQSAATSGQRVILIDCDLRHPSVRNAMHVDQKVGVVEYLTGQAELADAIVKDPKTGLDYMVVCSTPANPADIISSAHFRNLIAALRSDYDLVILDSPPVLPVVDSKLLARLADKALFAVKWRSTPRQAVIKALGELGEADADMAGTILTQVNMKRISQYQYGGYTSYYGRYSKYYLE